MWHLVAVTVHALFATAALVVGVLALRPGGTGLIRAHAVCVTGMSGVLPVSLAAGWAGFDGAARPVFVGLFLLSVVMVVRAWRALRVADDAAAVVAHVGFNLVALVIGILIVPALRLGFGVAGIVVVVVVTVVVGHLTLGRLQRRRRPRAV